MAKIILKLYVAGESAALKKSIAELRNILNENFDGNYDLTVIDIMKHPEIAERDKIMAAPTLLKQLPPPARKIIGDMTNKEKVLLGLDIIKLKNSR